MFEEQTFEEIITRMLSNVDDKFDKREGSIIYDALAPISMELAFFFNCLDMVMNEVFADTASYYYLIKRAAEKGLLPKEETQAILKMEVTPANVAIMAGDRFNLNDLNYTVVKKVEDTTGVYQIECETAGTIGNQQLGLLLPLETANELNDLETAELTEILIPGEDEEDVEDFRERYFSSFNNEAFGGNKQDYKEKVNDINGVGGCKVMRAWDGGYNPSDLIPTAAVTAWFDTEKETLADGIKEWLTAVYTAAKNKLLTVGGTVKCYIITSEFKAPSSTLVATVQNALDPDESTGEGDGLAPIGHVVKVQGVREIPINIEPAIVFRDGLSFSSMKEPIEEVIDSYFMELAEKWDSNDKLIVRISQIESRLISLDGIIDVLDLKINGTSENIVLDIDAVPVRGDVIG